ncbi:MAG: Trm112 family protein [Thermoprotei archaeon]|nr:MAG: Trm112 family protein [Thermoprotei archaeon]
MRYALLNLLACPMCKHFPLKLYVFEKRKLSAEYSVKTPFCDVFCGLKEAFIKELDVEQIKCGECLKEDIVSGILVCPNCKRWYPIIDGIPWMYPDKHREHLRIKRREEDFIRKYYELLPLDVRKSITLK